MELPFLLLLLGLLYPMIAELCEMPQSFSIIMTILLSETQVSGWACLGVDPLDIPGTPYRAREGKRSQ